MPYTHIRLVGHTPFTGKGAGHDSVDENLEDVKKAVRLAAAEVDKLSDGPEVLPVFLAPEWTWKLNGRRNRGQAGGFYGYGDLGKIMAELLKLSGLYREMLLIPGTVLWSIPGKVATEEAKKSFSWSKFKFVVENHVSEKAVALVYNTAPVLFGGSVIHFYHKQFEWNDADGPDQLFAFDPGAGKAKVFWKGFKEPSKSVDTAGAAIKPLVSNIFKVGELTFGIEIGADIFQKTLQKAGKPVDVQVLLSGGAGFELAAIATNPAGVALHCDGNTKDPDNKSHGLNALVIRDKAVDSPLYGAEGKSFYGSGGADGRVVVLGETVAIVPEKEEEAVAEPSDGTLLAGLTAEEFETYRFVMKGATKEEIERLYKRSRPLAKFAAAARRVAAENVEKKAPLKDFKIVDQLTAKILMGDAIKGLTQKLDSLIAGLGNLNLELGTVGHYLSQQSDKVHWIQGPIKISKSAASKTIKQLKFDWTENRDLIRGTLAADDDAALELGVAAVRKICKPEFGISATETVKTADKDKCGYSDYNFKMLFNGFGTHAEIQVNTYALMYGKMEPGDYMRSLKVPEDEYKKLRTELGFPGGLGHAFYEIFGRSKPEFKETDSKKAAELSKKYYAACRNQSGASSAEVKELNRELDAFDAYMRRDDQTNVEGLDVWKHVKYVRTG